MGSVMDGPAVTRRKHRVHAADGTALHLVDYLLPLSEARGGVVIMHGLGEHSGRYQHLARFFNDCGLSVRCYDHRGHGQSEGPRGDVPQGRPILQDLEIIIDDFALHCPGLPFLFGHSMGGLFAAHFALSKASPLRGLILSSPALAVRLSGFQRKLLNFMFRFFPYYGVPNGLSPQYLSHDQAIVDAYKNDPLVHAKISARLLRSMLASIDYCQAHAATLAIPTLMLVAGDDHLVDAEGSHHFFAQLPVEQAHMHVYQDLYHEVFNEKESRQPFSDLRTWLETQTHPVEDPASISM
jgi:alpha-beta hydrolase superfamily lysophospholipase